MKIQKINKNKKGVTILIVTIISTCIALIMACTFFLTSTYNSSIIKKENEIRKSLNNNIYYGTNMYVDFRELSVNTIADVLKLMPENFPNKDSQDKYWANEHNAVAYIENNAIVFFKGGNTFYRLYINLEFNEKENGCYIYRQICDDIIINYKFKMKNNILNSIEISRTVDQHTEPFELEDSDLDGIYTLKEDLEGNIN